MGAKITDARNAVWASINNHEELKENGQSVFRTQLRYDGEQPLVPWDEIETWLSLARLPCLTIAPNVLNIDWQRNTDQQWIFQPLVTFWTPTHRLDRAEHYAEQIVRAVHTAVSSGTMTYIEAATMQSPLGTGQIQFAATRIGEVDGDEQGIAAIRTEIQLNLRIIPQIRI